MKLLRLEGITTHSDMELFNSNSIVAEYLASFTAKNNFGAVMVSGDDEIAPAITAWRQKFYEDACNALSEIFRDVPRQLFDYGFRFQYLETEIVIGEPFMINWGGHVKNDIPESPSAKSK